MRSKQASHKSETFAFENLTNERILFPVLIGLIWFIVYLVCQVVFEQKLGWDEVAYMSVAKGIANDFDFSARAYTVMGILKQGFPSHLINFPVFPIWVAVVFKFFGCSLKVAYSSSWLCTLGVCLFIYFIFLILSPNNYKTAFLTSLAYLFYPGVLKNCDSAMMEQAGCFLLCCAVYLILKDYARGVFNHFTVIKFALSFLIIWLFKSLFVGFFFGSFVFMCLAYNSKLSEKKINAKFPLIVFVILTYGLFIVLFYLLMKFVFLPVSPMMTFSHAAELSQRYADFLGGFLDAPVFNLLTNLGLFFNYVVLPLFIYPTTYTNPNSQFFVFIPYIACIWIYFFVLFAMIILTFSSWKNLSSTERLFVGLTLGTIVSFNMVFNILFTTTYENIWRYNLYSLPLFLCYTSLIFKANYVYVKSFFNENPLAGKAIIGLLLILCWLPVFLSMNNLQVVLSNAYHNRAASNAMLVKNFIGEESPKFIYFNDGTHTTFIDYPVRQIFKDATNEQLLQLNKILPEPVKYLFLSPGDWLFKNNQEQISKGQPILNNQYNLFGFSKEAQVVVYKYGNEKLN